MVQVFDKYGVIKRPAILGVASWGSIVGTITDQTDLIAYLNGNYVPKSYLVYTALLSNDGSGLPVFTELENTLGITITPSITSPGEYLINSDISLPLLKTTIDIGVPKANANITAKYLYTVIHNNTTQFTIQAYQAAASTWNKSHFNFWFNLFEIRVYP